MALRFLNSGYFAGSVGIGTDSPGAKLEVKSSANLNSFVNITTTTDAYNSGISLRQSSNYGFDVYYTDDGVSPSVRGLHFDRVNNGSVANAMFIDRNNGNVGINNTSPATYLAVGSASHTSPSNTNRILNWYSSTGGTEITNSSYYITVGQSSSDTSQPKSVGLALFNPNIANNTYSPAITFGGLATSGDFMTGAAAIATKLFASYDTNFRSGDLKFYTCDGSTLATRGLTEKMVITSTGNVGIGTTTPDALLELSKDVSGGQGATLRLTNSVGGSGAGSAIEFVGPGTQPIHAKIITEDAAAFDSNIIFQTKATATAGALADRLTIDNVGAIQFNDYGAGTLITDASGNITVSSGGGVGGPYLPLDGGTMIGNTIHNDNVKSIYGTASDGLEIYHDGTDSYINDTGTGGLIIRAANNIKLQTNQAELYLQGIKDGAVKLYYNNAEKLLTTSTGVAVTGNIKIQAALLSNQENTDIDSAAAEVVAQVSITDYTAAFFDFVVKKGTNVRSGTVYACHDGTNVEFTETSTNDLGDTSDVTLSVDKTSTNLRLIATVTSDDWSVKSLIRAI